MDEQAVRLAKQTRAIAGLVSLLALFATCGGLGRLPILWFTGLCYLQADARVRGHALPTGEAYSTAAFPHVGLPWYLYRTRGWRGMLIVGALFTMACGCAGVKAVFS